MTNSEKLQTVPLPIRTWFWSDEMDQIVLELEEQFGLPEDETVIPRLLFAIEVRDLELEKLPSELAKQLGIPAATASTLYGEIKRRVFEPLAREFVRFGIGTNELAGLVIAAPAAASSRPDPVVVGIAPAPAPAPVSAAPAAIPQPVSLYRDTLASQKVASTASFGSLNTGDISASVSSAPSAPRAAHVDLGIPQSPRAEKEFRSIFVERTLPKQATINYDATPSPQAQPTPVPLAAAPAPASDPAPFVQPSLEVVNVPTRTASPAAKQGFFDAVMHRIAPWHASRFGHGKPLPSVDYAESPAPTPAASQAAPVPLGDMPTPPTSPQA